MSHHSQPAKTSWKPRGIAAWILTIFSVLFVLLMAGLAYCMLVMAQFDSLVGFVELYALIFPLHVLVFTVVAAVLAFIAWLSRARLAKWIYVLTVILTAAMALIPTFAILASARAYNAPVSLGDYLANATHINSGEPQTERSVVYGTAKDGTKLELDVWLTGQPNTGPMRPAIVFVHGGGWIVGNRSGKPDWDIWLNQIGYDVFDVEYRMPPPVRWQDEVGDVKAAVGWVAAHATDYHLDPARIIMMGESAGGNLALLTAYSMGDPQLPASTDVAPVAIRCVVSLYGPTEMAKLWSTTASSHFVQKGESEYIGGTPEAFPDRYHALSPLYHINAKTPPTIAFNGTSDSVVPADQTIMLDQALSKAGVVHQTYFLSATEHSFDSNWGGFATQIATYLISGFLKKYC